jgi:hypothetical protein
MNGGGSRGALRQGLVGPHHFEEVIMDEPDIQGLIKELAKTGADPFWVMEAIAEEQAAEAERREAAAAGLRRTQTGQPARPHPQLRVVVGGRE